MSKIQSIKLFFSDRQAFHYQSYMFVNRYTINTIKFFVSIISRLANKFFTFHLRPIESLDYKLWSDPLKKNEKIAIIMQGPIKYELDFTLESIKIYKKNFPNTKIIVSVLENENIDYLKKIEKHGCIVVVNKKPQMSGIGNINFQIISTVGGLEKAKEIGVEYVYKTRTDQRIYGINLNEYLINLLNFFPPVQGYEQKKRIIASSFSTLKYVPYLLTDTFLFGDIDDMIKYWSLDLDKRAKPDNFIKSIRDLIDARTCESLLCSKYLEKIGRKLEWTVLDSWKAFADHFIIIDKQVLDAFFYKYDYYREHGQFNYEGITNNHLLDFADWFNFYVNLNNKKCDNLEKVIDLPRRDSIISENYGN